ncbi:MAG: peptidylprolyl isomerase, partial [Patescibacteria group bacterium]
AVIKTPKGDIELELYPNDAPKTVTNFATLAKNGFYDCLKFHRYEPGFVIQGGDPSGNGTGGESIYGPEFADELNPDTESYKNGYKEGVLAMANRGPNTNSSQFFIILADNDTLPKNYTIFGKVTGGLPVVQSIRANDEITTIEISQ